MSALEQLPAFLQVRFFCGAGVYVHVCVEGAGGWGLGFGGGGYMMGRVVSWCVYTHKGRTGPHTL